MVNGSASRTGRTFENSTRPTCDVVGLLQDSTRPTWTRPSRRRRKRSPAGRPCRRRRAARSCSSGGVILEGKLAEMADLLSREEGKTIGEAKGEVTRAVRILYFGGEGARMSGQIDPVGAAARVRTRSGSRSAWWP